MKRFLALLTLLMLTACTPGLDDLLLGGGAENSAQVTYGVASGDTAGFDLSPFASRHLTAAWVGERLRVTLFEGGNERALQLTAHWNGDEPLSCPLTTGSRHGAPPGVTCSLYYWQTTESSDRPALEPHVVSGTLELRSRSSGGVAFSLEAVLETAAGGRFRLRASGRAAP